MARLPRFNFPGHPQHVIVRGNNREPIFRADEDYQFYLAKLERACEQHRCDLHAYVLMTNHVHLLITPHTEHGIGKVLQMVGRYYVQYFNHAYRRTGTLWEGRYKAALVDSERYLLTCYRYIELNPVRAQGMVDHPGDYRWSSYRVNALGAVGNLITPHALYRQLGRSVRERQEAYRDLFTDLIPRSVLDQIRETTNKAWVLGSDGFKGMIENQLSRATQPKNRGGDRKSKSYRESLINRV